MGAAASAQGAGDAAWQATKDTAASGAVRFAIQDASTVYCPACAVACSLVQHNCRLQGPRLNGYGTKLLSRSAAILFQLNCGLPDVRSCCPAQCSMSPKILHSGGSIVTVYSRRPRCHCDRPSSVRGTSVAGRCRIGRRHRVRVRRRRQGRRLRRRRCAAAANVLCGCGTAVQQLSRVGGLRTFRLADEERNCVDSACIPAPSVRRQSC